MNIATAARATTVALLVLAVSSCGRLSSDDEFLDQSPRAMAKTAFRDMRAVTSLRMLGSADTDVGLTRVDVRLDADSCVGSLDTSEGGFRLVKNSDGAWFNADNEFWRSQAPTRQQGETLIAAYAGSWVELDGKTDIGEFCDLDGLLSNFKLDKSDTEDRIDGGEVEKVGDADAVALDGRDGKERITVWVAVDAPHHVLKMAPTNDTGEAEALYFEEFGVDVVAETPAKDDIAKISTGKR